MRLDRTTGCRVSVTTSHSPPAAHSLPLRNRLKRCCVLQAEPAFDCNVSRQQTMSNVFTQARAISILFTRFVFVCVCVSAAHIRYNTQTIHGMARYATHNTLVRARKHITSHHKTQHNANLLDEACSFASLTIANK